MNKAVKQAGGRCYQASEFARLAGVTVRTLRHYDRSGLSRRAATSPWGAG